MESRAQLENLLRKELAKTLQIWFEQYSADPLYELEARIKGIDAISFAYIRRQLDSCVDWRSTEVLTTVDIAYSSGSRGTTAFDSVKGTQSQPSTYIFKTQVECIDINLNNGGGGGIASAPEMLRCSCETEEPAPVPRPGDLPENYRFKRRYRYNRKGEFLFELTEVRGGQTIAEAQSAPPSYEVELEWCGREIAKSLLPQPGGSQFLVEKFILKVADLISFRRQAEFEHRYPHLVSATSTAVVPQVAQSLIPVNQQHSQQITQHQQNTRQVFDEDIPAAKRSKSGEGEEGATITRHQESLDSEKTAQKVASAYDNLVDLGREGRQRSGILHLRNFNNWVKATLVQKHAPKPSLRVLDLACGKAGDLPKWLKAGVTNYAGVDISRQAVDDAAKRFNEMCGSGKGSANSVSAKFAQADLGCTDLGAKGFLAPDERFDVISVQFALHYLFQSEKRALSFFRNIAGRLLPGGVFLGTIPDAAKLVRSLRDKASPASFNVHSKESITFGNSICTVTFPAESVNAQWNIGSSPYGIRYTFFLNDRETGGAPVDHIDEYLVPWELLERLAAAAGLRPLTRLNFHSWFEIVTSSSTDAKELLKKMSVLDCEGTMPVEDWEVVGLYRVFAFERIPDTERRDEKTAENTSLLDEVQLSRSSEISSKRKGAPYKNFIQSSDIFEL
jgi:mRNA (guanine-N7-)-methyltransferase